MQRDLLTRTFGYVAALAVAVSPLAYRAIADSIPQPVITSIVPVSEVSTNLATQKLQTNNVYRITATNAVPGHVYSIQSRQNLNDGENLENFWYTGASAQGRADGTLLFKPANRYLPQESFRIQTLDTNTVPDTNGVANASK